MLIKKSKLLTNTYSSHTNCTYKYNLPAIQNTQSNSRYDYRYISCSKSIKSLLMIPHQLWHPDCSGLEGGWMSVMEVGLQLHYNFNLWKEKYTYICIYGANGLMHWYLLINLDVGFMGFLMLYSVFFVYSNFFLIQIWRKFPKWSKHC